MSHQHSFISVKNNRKNSSCYFFKTTTPSGSDNDLIPSFGWGRWLLVVFVYKNSHLPTTHRSSIRRFYLEIWWLDPTMNTYLIWLDSPLSIYLDDRALPYDRAKLVPTDEILSFHHFLSVVQDRLGDEHNWYLLTRWRVRHALCRCLFVL